MKNKRILLATQEMKPYVMESEFASIVKELAPYLQNKGAEIRVLMPRFGTINERRHRLHEVVRLSGINISLGEEDYPMMIKVASLPGARIQIYFLDNDDLFKRKGVYGDKKTSFYEDNGERAVFFCKGVLETVKKFGWDPDIIHCHGWMTSFIPLFVKTAYKNEPIFQDSKVVYSVYDSSFIKGLNTEFIDKAVVNNAVKSKDVESYKSNEEANLIKGAVHYSDAVIKENTADKLLNEKVGKLNGKLVLDHPQESFTDKYYKFYQELLEVQTT